jgi:hypothetical protein
MRGTLTRALKLGAAALLATLAISFTVAGPAAASIPRPPTLHTTILTPVVAQHFVLRNGTMQPFDTLTFTFPQLNSGDCTLYNGSQWVLNSTGGANFTGTVHSTDDNDAWLMYAHLRTGSGAQIEDITSSYTDTNEFFYDMPNSDDSYYWQASGFFDSGDYSIIGSMQVSYSC